MSKDSAFVLAFTFMLIFLVTPLGFKWPVTETEGVTTLQKFSSYEELRNFIHDGMERARVHGGFIWTYQFSRGNLPAPIPLAKSLGGVVAEGTTVQSSPSYSETNVQVEGVDEADIVKTDGKYIYFASGGTVVIVSAYPPREAEVLSRIKLGGTVVGLFVNDEKLVVFEEEQGWRNMVEQPSPGISVKVYDVSDRGNPTLKGEISLEGWYFSSRMIGDYVYLVVNTPAIRPGERNVVLPRIYWQGQLETVPATRVYYTNFSDVFYFFTTIIALNIKKPEQKPAYETFLTGATTCMYVSQNNMYVAIPKITPVHIMTIPLKEAEETLIYRVRIRGEEIKCVASGEVPGLPLNQFSMDEHKGYFRIATTTGHVARNLKEATSRNHVYILDMNLEIVGKLENLAPGEKIHSARFMGERCYLVTFKKVDPLFVIELKDPENPRVLGKLKIPGYSDYLHPYDETHLIGIGKETVEAEEGDFAWYQGVKMSIFDVSDVSKPKELAKYVIGDRGTDTPVLRNHKALLFDKSRKLLVLPVLVAEIDEEKYPGGVPPNVQGEYTWQGAYVFHVSLKKGFVFKGGVTHLDDKADLLKSGYYFNSPYTVKRALYIDDTLYTVSDKKIKMNNLKTLEEINEVNLQ